MLWASDSASSSDSGSCALNPQTTLQLYSLACVQHSALGINRAVKKLELHFLLIGGLEAA